MATMLLFSMMALLATCTSAVLTAPQRAPSPPPHSELYTEQQVDHFNYELQDTFMERYFLSGKRCAANIGKEHALCGTGTNRKPRVGGAGYYPSRPKFQLFSLTPQMCIGREVVLCSSTLVMRAPLRSSTTTLVSCSSWHRISAPSLYLLNT